MTKNNKVFEYVDSYENVSYLSLIDYNAGINDTISLVNLLFSSELIIYAKNINQCDKFIKQIENYNIKYTKCFDSDKTNIILNVHVDYFIQLWACLFRTKPEKIIIINEPENFHYIDFSKNLNLRCFDSFSVDENVRIQYLIDYKKHCVRLSYKSDEFKISYIKKLLKSIVKKRY